jgi:hypothetical protein
MIALLKKTALGVLKSAFTPLAGGKVTGVAHAVLVAAALVGLWRLNLWLGLDEVVHAPSQLVREWWLPLLLLLGYGLVWISLWTWRAFSEPSAGSPFPDIDDAWRTVASAMQRWGISLSDKPLVFVLGQPSMRENDLLSALHVTPTFGPAPSSSGSPLSVVADDRATYLLCYDASLLSLGGEKLVQRRATQRSRQACAATPAVESAMPAALRASSIGGSDASGTATLVAPAVTHDAFEDVSTCEAPAQPLFTDEQAARCAGRLGHLLRLVARDREPGLPIDAATVVFPCDALSDAATAAQMADAMRQDLAILEEAGVRCGVVAVGVDLQHVPGAGQLLHTLPADRKSRVFGAKLPHDALTSEAAMRDAVDWLTGSVTPTLCQRLFQFDEDGFASLADNAALHAFQSEIGRRGEQLANLLAQGLESDNGEAWPCVGAYLVATGDPVGGSQAFGAGVLDGLFDSHARAAWTDESVQRDTLLTRGVVFGYAAIGFAATVVLGLLAF